eukprot:3477240-Heterocapsa_arctica.AAC.1
MGHNAANKTQQKEWAEETRENKYKLHRCFHDDDLGNLDFVGSCNQWAPRKAISVGLTHVFTLKGQLV